MPKIKLPSFSEIEEMSTKAIKSWLNKLKPIATKRAEAIVKAGKESYIKDLGIKMSNYQDARSELSNISQFLRKPFSKVSNIKKFENMMYKSLNERGYDIDKKYITGFNEYMAEVKAKYKGRRIPDSTRVAEVAVQAQRLRMSKRAFEKNMNYWIDHLEELKQLSTSEAKGKYSANYIMNRINKLK